MFQALMLAAFIIFLTILILLNIFQRERKIKHVMTALYGVEDGQFFRSMSNLLGPPLLEGNRIKTLLNGDQIFPAMLQAIQAAQKSITFETYIYWSGEIGEKFTHALSERAKAGVNVHVLLDWIGSLRMDRRLVRRMKRAGINVQRYRPLHWYQLARFNNRTHRKLLVIDGKIGFIGGAGIGDPWSGNAQDPKHWRDTHFQVEGPAVAQIQSAFMDNWLKTASSVLHGEAYFPELLPIGNTRAHVFKSSPGEGSESIQLFYLFSFAAAQKSIRIANPYFIPNELCLKALLRARRRGVEIEIILPGKYTDIEAIRKASTACWGRFLQSGVRMYEYLPTMYHAKIMIIDDLLVSVGSTNFDTRSFWLNDEANLNIMDQQFAREQIAIFEQDKEKSEEVTYQQWKKRPWFEILLSGFANLLRSQL